MSGNSVAICAFTEEPQERYYYVLFKVVGAPGQPVNLVLPMHIRVPPAGDPMKAIRREEKELERKYVGASCIYADCVTRL